MATGRIEGERDAAASIVQPIHGALAEIGPSEAAAVAAPRLARYLDFEALIDIAGRRTSCATTRSLRQYIVDFVEPRISDPTVFQNGRSLSILEHLASDIIPTLDESKELRSLAGAIIADEIERHRELVTRLHSGIAQ